MADWDGAQWVMACYLAFKLACPMLVRGAGLDLAGPPWKRRSNAEWTGRYLSKVVGAAALVAVLDWGGFY